MRRKQEKIRKYHKDICGLCSGLVFDQIGNVTRKSATYSVQHVTIVTHHPVFIVIVHDLKPYSGAFCQLISSDPLLIQILIQC